MIVSEVTGTELALTTATDTPVKWVFEVTTSVKLGKHLMAHN